MSEVFHATATAMLRRGRVPIKYTAAPVSALHIPNLISHANKLTFSITAACCRCPTSAAHAVAQLELTMLVSGGRAESTGEPCYNRTHYSGNPAIMESLAGLFLHTAI